MSTKKYLDLNGLSRVWDKTENKYSKKILSIRSAYGTSSSSSTLPTRWTLPAEYQEIEYLQSTAVELIDTGIDATDVRKIECKFAPMTASTSQYITGARASSPNTILYAIDGSSTVTKFSALYNANSVLTTDIDRVNGQVVVASVEISEAVNGKRKMTFKCNDGTYDETVTKSNCADLETTGYNIHIFGWNNNNKTAIRLYREKIYTDEGLVRDYVPCLNKTTGKYGLYDMVNSQFYTSTVDFTLYGNATTYVPQLTSDTPYMWEQDVITYADGTTQKKSPYVIEQKSEGGSGGTTDYTDLTNKPQINSVTLTGNKSLSDLGAADGTLYTDTTINTGRSANSTTGTYSTAVGVENIASQQSAFAEGEECTASGEASHAGGMGSVASGMEALAFGDYVTASGDVSVAIGEGILASSNNQVAVGKYNVEDNSDTYSEIVGNGEWVVGTGAVRSNARTTDWQGNGWYAGNIKVGGTSYSDSNAKELATKDYIDSLVVDGAKKTILYNGKATNTAVLSGNIQQLSDSIFNYDLIVVGFNCLVQNASRSMEICDCIYPNSNLITWCDTTGAGATGAHHIFNSNQAFNNCYRVIWGFTDATHIRNIVSAHVNTGTYGWVDEGICYVIGYKFSALPDGYIQEPATEGTSGQVLTTDGNGGRTWTTVSGGGGGTSDYTQLTNKPQINSVTLTGNVSLSTLGAATEQYVDNKITYGTSDLTAGTSQLTTGTLYFVYE